MMRYTAKQLGRWRIDHYRSESLGDLFHHIDSTPRHKGAGESSQKEGRGHTWDMGIGYAGAVTLAKAREWREGADQIRRGVLHMESAPQSLGSSMQLTHDVAGFAPDVPAYLAGEPESMFWIEPGEAQLAGPIISIGVQIICSAGTKANVMLNRGIALLTAIDSLESAGYRCELTAVYAAGSDKDGMIWEHQVKAPGDQWNPGAVAFPLAHIGFARRLGFAMQERCPRAWKCTRDGYGGGLARGSGVTGYWGQYDLAMSEYVIGGEEQWSTPDKALAHIKTRLAPVLEQRRAHAEGRAA